MAYKREDITGFDALNLKKLNDNIRYLWSKVFGDINLTDIANDVKAELYTNWLQPQGEGNLDSTHPFYIRFYIPESTKKIKSGLVNLMTSKYRLDSDIAQANSSNIAITGITLGQSTNNTSGASSSSTTTDGGSSSYTSTYAGGTTLTSEASSINTTGYPTSMSGSPVTDDAIVSSLGVRHNHGFGVPNHAHGMSHTHVVQPVAHYHTVTTDNHSHGIDHYHTINHTHDINSTATLPAHTHDINFGIKDSTVIPQGIKLLVNSIDTGITLNGDGQVANNLDITDKLIVGWNILTITSTNIARITLYGIVEALQTFK